MRGISSNHEVAVAEQGLLLFDPLYTGIALNGIKVNLPANQVRPEQFFAPGQDWSKIAHAQFALILCLWNVVYEYADGDVNIVRRIYRNNPSVAGTIHASGLMIDNVLGGRRPSTSYAKRHDTC